MLRALGLALAVSAAVGAAAAQDACLGGASALSDQRALAELRAGIDAACPCTGVGGGGAFRRCAKPLLADGLATGVLRAECAGRAATDVKTASCGTAKSPCGAFAAEAGVAACRIRKPAACQTRKGVVETACLAETHCSDVVDWTAGICLDARDAGPWRAGALRLVFTKPSVLNPSETRTLDTVVWYPTLGTGPTDPATGGILDAPLDAASPRPIVLFSHGLCGVPTQSRFLTVQLATYGYVVIAPSHPQSTAADCLAGTSSLVASALERPAEVSSVLDQMLAANDTPASPFFGALDATRIAMSGHSFGAFTTFKVAAQDARIDVAIPLAGYPPSPPALGMPLLGMIGLLDSVVSPTGFEGAWQAATGEKVLVELEHAGHYAFSDVCLPGFPVDCNYPTTLSQDEAHALVLRYVLPFLEQHLRGDASRAAFFVTPAPPGVLVQRVAAP
jgi:predicted dienelactone hydrolase